VWSPGTRRARSRAATAAATNAGTYFQPAGCLTSTRSGSVVTHVFDDCTGPYGRLHLTGTVTPTWSLGTTGVSVAHASQGFQINGAVVDLAVTATYGYENGVYTWHRVGTMDGSTADGLPIDHTVDTTTAWDATALCITRNGNSSTSIEGRDFSRQITGYERCGVGFYGCPSAGTFTLVRGTSTVIVHFNGGRSYDLTVDGRTFSDRQMLWCTPS
jgi:hypothetical protein